jgi:hypothetical protein
MGKETAKMDQASRWQKSCDGMGTAVDGASLGNIVAKTQLMINDYYADVQRQANMSFYAACVAASVGFGVLIGSLIHAIGLESGSQLANQHPAAVISPSTLFSLVGVASGMIIEFIAYVSFRLYGQCSRQFAAFHICLERTNRYLVAYKIADRIEINKDQTLHDIVCIMANAPMITQRDIDSGDLMVPRTPGGNNGNQSPEARAA